MKKYTKIFGPQELFNEAPKNAIIAIKDNLSNTKFYYFSESGWIKNNHGRWLNCDVYQIAMRHIEEVPNQHSDDLHVKHFADLMKKKLSECREKGRGGWEECPIEFLNSELIRHLYKGDPIDVANFAMMIHERNEKIKAPDEWK